MNFLADFRLPISNKMLLVTQLQADFMDEKQSQLSSTDEYNELRDDARTLVDARVGLEIGSWNVYFWILVTTFLRVDAIVRYMYILL